MITILVCRLHSGQIKAEPGNPWGASDYPGGGHPNPVPDFPSASSVHPLERNYSPHPGYPNMPSTGNIRRTLGTKNGLWVLTYHILRGADIGTILETFIVSWFFLLT